MTAVNCPNWSAIEAVCNGGVCSARGRTVSLGVCRACLGLGQVVPSLSPELAAARLALCKTCDEYNGNLCERQFPAGCCRCKWLAFTRAPASECPLERWGEQRGLRPQGNRQ